jgi:O-antigen/teichoic acid export membrane protein
LLEKIKSILLKDSYKKVGIYTITASLCKAMSFAALPFFVNTLSEGDIGILNIFSNSIVFLTPIISMGVLYTISIDYFKLSKEKYAATFSTGLLIPVALSLVLIPLFYLLRAPLQNAFNFQPSFFWLIPLCLFFNFCFEAFIILLRNQNKVKLFATVSFIKIVLEIGLSIIFILHIYSNWYARALAFLLSGLVIAALFLYHSRKNHFLVTKIQLKGIKTELYFGLSGLVLQTAIFFITTADKFFVMSFFGKTQAGYYAVASTFATIQYIICVSLLQYLQPVLFKEFAAFQTWKNLKPIYLKYFGAMLLTLFSVIIFTIFVYHFVLKAAYLPYLSYFFILSISSFIWTISNIFLQYIIFKKNRNVIFLLASTAIAISIAVNYSGSKYFDINWLSFGQIFINLLVLVMIVFFNKKLKFFA